MYVEAPVEHPERLNAFLTREHRLLVGGEALPRDVADRWAQGRIHPPLILSAEQVNSALRKYVKPDSFVTAVSGDFKP